MAVFVLLGNSACNAHTPTPKQDQLKLPLPGQIVVDRANPAWLKYGGRGPYFLAGLGDPEDFLYRGSQNADVTRDSYPMVLIDKLKGTGANGIHFQAVRSHGGDGEATHNSLIDNDPDKGLNFAILDQREVRFSQLESAGVVIYFFSYDDSARIWPQGPPSTHIQRSKAFAKKSPSTISSPTFACKVLISASRLVSRL